jgi:hypothetical protein
LIEKEKQKIKLSEKNILKNIPAFETLPEYIV